MAQELVGTTVKILTCSVVAKEVSSSTIGGEIGGDSTGSTGTGQGRWWENYLGRLTCL